MESILFEDYKPFLASRTGVATIRCRNFGQMRSYCGFFPVPAISGFFVLLYESSSDFSRQILRSAFLGISGLFLLDTGNVASANDDVLPGETRQVRGELPPEKAQITTRVESISGKIELIQASQRQASIIGSYIRLQSELSKLEDKITEIMPKTGGVLIEACVDELKYEAGNMYLFRKVRIVGPFDSEQDAEKSLVQRVKASPVLTAAQGVPTFQSGFKDRSDFEQSSCFYIWRASSPTAKYVPFACNIVQPPVKSMLEGPPKRPDELYRAFKATDQQLTELSKQISTEQNYLEAQERILEAKSEALAALKRQLAESSQRLAMLTRSIPNVKEEAWRRANANIASLEQRRVSAQAAIQVASAKYEEFLGFRREFAKQQAALRNLPELLSEEYWLRMERKYNTLEAIKPLTNAVHLAHPSGQTVHLAMFDQALALNALNVTHFRSKVTSLEMELSDVERQIALAKLGGENSSAVVEESVKNQELAHERQKQKIETATDAYLEQANALNISRQSVSTLRSEVDKMIEIQFFLHQLMSIK